MQAKTGQKPGMGAYECTKCGNNVNLDENSDKMPPCASCHNTSFNKVSDMPIS